MTSQMNFSYSSVPIATILNDIRNKERQGGINLQPPYQRGYVWSNDFKEKLIYSIIRQYPIGNISLRHNEGIKEVVDGQQRLTTIFNFMSNDINFEIKGEYAKKIVEYIMDYLGDDYEDPALDSFKKRLNNKTGIKLKYNQLPEVIKSNIQAYNISFTNITNADDGEITEFFRFLQNQERLKAGEIINSMPETSLEKYLDKINDIDKFLELISFRNDRRNFDKHFYSVLGVLTKDLSFGVTDKQVVNYSMEVEATDLEQNVYIDALIKNINVITEDNEPNVNPKGISNVRSLKYLLLLFSFSKINFMKNGYEKIKKLLILNEKLSSFNSAKIQAVEKAFLNYDSNVIEELRVVTLLSKGAHPFERVKNRMDILAMYLNGEEINEHTKASMIEII